MTDWIIISEGDLVDPRRSGGRIRAYCHIHGSDHQRSLSIDETRGFGDCHSCGAHVLVREINPEAAENIERRGAQGTVYFRDPRYLANARAKKAPEPACKRWQIEELDLLRGKNEVFTQRLTNERAATYIAQRGIGRATATQYRVGYVPEGDYRGKYERLARWADRLIFPVESPGNGLHFVGRSLKFWVPGMDEEQHKAILKEHHIDRHIKTYSGGWFNYQALAEKQVVFCEGAFDALALIEAGIPHAVAVIGTAITHEWIPKDMGKITIAFDGDTSGREKSEKAREALYLRGFDVSTCSCPDDGMGKDWSERYRLHGRLGLAPLFEAPLDTCACGLSVNDDPGLGEYDEDGQYTCSKHCQEQTDEADMSYSPTPRELLEQHVEKMQHEQREAYLQACATGRLRKG